MVFVGYFWMFGVRIGARRRDSYRDTLHLPIAIGTPLTFNPMRPPIIEAIRQEVGSAPKRRAKRRELPKPAATEEIRYLFEVHSGNRWLELAEREPDLLPLFGPFWRQGELCLLFADTNVGKSILAVQIANSIARRRRIPPFAAEAPRCPVLYVDFELSTSQFAARCSDKSGEYRFPKRFYRAGISPKHIQTVTEAEQDTFILDAIAYRVQQLGARVLLIDNISCLQGGTENTILARRLIRGLRELQQRFCLSVLVLAHTPKRRNPTRPISANDLQGSKMLINLADSAFAIGSSKTQEGLRYLKQIKQRTGELLYDEGKVCLCRIVRKDKLLRFNFLGTGREAQHLLPRQTNKSLPYSLTLRQQVQNLAKQKLSQRKISARLGISLGMVNLLVRGIDKR